MRSRLRLSTVIPPLLLESSEIIGASGGICRATPALGLAHRVEQLLHGRLVYVFLRHHRHASVDSLVDRFPALRLHSGLDTEVTHLERVLHDQSLDRSLFQPL